MTYALLDIAVYRGEGEAVIERQEEVHYENIAEEITENNFEIGHFGCTCYHARYGDESYAREGGANHADCENQN